MLSFLLHVLTYLVELTEFPPSKHIHARPTPLSIYKTNVESNGLAQQNRTWRNVVIMVTNNNVRKGGGGRGKWKMRRENAKLMMCCEL